MARRPFGCAKIEMRVASRLVHAQPCTAVHRRLVDALRARSFDLHSLVHMHQPMRLMFKPSPTQSNISSTLKYIMKIALLYHERTIVNMTKAKSHGTKFIVDRAHDWSVTECAFRLTVCAGLHCALWTHLQDAVSRSSQFAM